MPVWIDLIASPSDWAASFLSDEAAEVLAVLGGLLLVFPLPGTAAPPEPTRELIRQIGRVVQDGLGGWEWDGVGVAVGVGEGPTEEWDELCAEAGFEFVQVKGTEGEERNEFGGKKTPHAFLFSATLFKQAMIRALLSMKREKAQGRARRYG